MGQAFAKLLADKNCDHGAIVNISSIAGKVCKFTRRLHKDHFVDFWQTFRFLTSAIYTREFCSRLLVIILPVKP